MRRAVASFAFALLACGDQRPSSPEVTAPVIAPVADAPVAPVAPVVTPVVAPAIELVESWPTETTLDSPLRDAAEVWLELVTKATTSIDLAEFYLSNEPNSRLEPIVKALEAALARHVRVRLLVEPSFTKVYPETIDRLAKAGAVVRRADFTPGILHAKYIVVDDRFGYLGSQNFDWRALDHIVELGARFEDQALVRDLERIFTSDWARAGNEAVPPATSNPPGRRSITLAASPKDNLPPGIEWDLPSLLGMIDGAKATIRIEALTYKAGDWIELEGALLRAVQRGVHVELLLADWMKRDKTLPGLRKLAKDARSLRLERGGRVVQVTGSLTIKLVTIPQAKRGFIPFARVTHAKLLVVDGARGWVGTSNFEKDYFYESRNVGLLIDDQKTTTALDRFFEHVWSSRYAIPFDPDAAYTPPRVGE